MHASLASFTNPAGALTRRAADLTAHELLPPETSKWVYEQVDRVTRLCLHVFEKRSASALYKCHT